MNFPRFTVFAPVVFVFLWSTGFIGARFGVYEAEPLTFLAIRFTVTALIFGVVILLTNQKWPDALADYLHLILIGLLIHGIYLGGVFVAIHRGLPTAISSIIVGLQPLVTIWIAALWLREELTAVKMLGIGLGLFGVFLVLGFQGVQQPGITATGIALSVLALCGISFGTVYQKQAGTEFALLPTMFVQFLANAVLLWAAARIFESHYIPWTGQVVLSLIWLVLVLSVGASFLLLWLIRHGEAGKVGSLFYLVPPCVAVEAWIIFDETLTLPAVAGMVLCVLGVSLVISGYGPARKTALGYRR